IANPETRFTTVVRRRFLQDSLELELRGAYTVDRGGWFVFPRVTYMIADGLTCELRYGFLRGPTSGNPLASANRFWFRFATPIEKPPATRVTKPWGRGAHADFYGDAKSEGHGV